MMDDSGQQLGRRIDLRNTLEKRRYAGYIGGQFRAGFATGEVLFEWASLDHVQPNGEY